MKRLIHQGILKAQGARIVSYPRSGRTWLRLMLHDLCIEPRFTHVGSKSILQHRADQILWHIEQYHRRRIVFLHREPRDVLVSYYHHCCRQGRFDGDLPSLVRDPNNGFERILAFNLGWLAAHADFKGFMVVGYEALRADPRTHLAKIAGFLRCALVRDSDIERAIANNSFKNMKKREQSGELRDQFGDRFTAGGSGDDKMIVRRGKIGGHADELDEADRAYCDDLLQRYDYAAKLAELVAATETRLAR